VSLVALFDTYAPAPAERLGLLRRVPGHLAALGRLGAREKLAYLWARAGHIQKRLRGAGWRLAFRLRSRGRQPLPEAFWDLYLMHRQALHDYVPQPYPGRLILFQAMAPSVGADPDPQMGWGGLAQGGLEIHAVPGDHASLLAEPNVAVLAEKLDPYLARIGSAEATAKVSPRQPASSGERASG
jgi:thioesterase domain-containing protein